MIRLRPSPRLRLLGRSDKRARHYRQRDGVWVCSPVVYTRTLRSAVAATRCVRNVCVGSHTGV